MTILMEPIHLLTDSAFQAFHHARRQPGADLKSCLQALFAAKQVSTWIAHEALCDQLIASLQAIEKQEKYDIELDRSVNYIWDQGAFLFERQ